MKIIAYPAPNVNAPVPGLSSGGARLFFPAGISVPRPVILTKAIDFSWFWLFFMQI